MPADSVQRAFLSRLIEHRHLIPSGVDGVFGRGAHFEGAVEAIDRAVDREVAGDGAERLRFPPVVTRRNFEKSEYLKSFPNLAGIVHSFDAGDREHVELLARLERDEADWSRDFPPAGLVMTPAACYPIYPTLTGTVAAEGRLFDVQSYCFRHEPSIDPARMQLFRMHEQVRVGTPASCTEFRDRWQKRGQSLLSSLALPAKLDVANDPFFGRAGRMLAANQRDQALKFELLVPITSEEKPTACLSFNYHQDHFGHLFEIRQPDGAWAHTACVGFGLERIALALFWHHGMEPAAWPAAVRGVLWP